MTRKTPMSPRPVPAIWLDTDPGGDDAVAIMWLASLARQERARLVGVSTVDGNVDPQQTYANAAGLLALLGLADVSVGRGARCTRARRRAARVHGEDGLGGQAARLAAPARAYAHAPDSVRLIVDRLEAQPGEITVLAIGPLTNLAAAERLRPGILSFARDIVVMGGGFAAGNVTPVAEFNVHFDPSSAAFCVNTRPDLAMIPLDLTLNLLLTRARIDAVVRDHRESPLANVLEGLCDFMIRTALHRGTSGGAEGFPVHDAATVAAVFYPETVSFSEGRLTVDDSDGPESGRTCFEPKPDDPNPARVAFDGDPNRLLDALCADLAWLLRSSDQSL